MKSEEERRQEERGKQQKRITVVEKCKCQPNKCEYYEESENEKDIKRRRDEDNKIGRRKKLRRKREVCLIV